MYSLWNNENIIPLVRVCISVQSKAKNGHMKQRWSNYIPSQETQRCEKLKVKGQKNISHITSIQKWADMATVQFSLSHLQLFATPLTAACQASPSITNSQSLFKFMSIESVMPSNHLILCHPLLLPPSVFPSMRVFSNKSVLCMGQPKYWSFSFSISPSKEYSGPISLRIEWFDLPAVQGTIRSLLQHHISKASILRCSAFFMVQLSHPYMTTSKTIALTRQTFVGKVMSLLFNTLSRLVTAFLPRSNCLLISWLQSPSAVILEPKKIKSVTVLFPHLFAMKWWDWMPWS